MLVRDERKSYLNSRELGRDAVTPLKYTDIIKHYEVRSRNRL